MTWTSGWEDTQPDKMNGTWSCADTAWSDCKFWQCDRLGLWL